MTDHISRRRLLAMLSAAAALGRNPLLAQTHIFSRKPKPKPVPIQPFVYFGTDTSRPGARGIYLSRFNPANGQLTQPVLVAETLRPSFLASATVNKRRLLYAVNEGADERSSAICTFLIDGATGALKQIGKVASAGAAPCYISVDADASAAFAANYTGGTVASFKVNPDGTLSDPVDRIDFHQAAFGKHGPNPARQDGPHPHSATISPDNRFLIVNDLGNDNIVTFFIHPDTAHLGPPRLNDCQIPGEGPRHVAFHPNQRWVYGINELTSTIQHYLWNTTHSASAPVALLTETGPPVSLLDPNFRGSNTAAEIVVAPEGTSIIASNRGEDSLVVFSLDPLRGTPSLLQRISCGGKAPRQFTVDSTGHWLLCGNQDSASVTVFARDQNTERLSGPVQTLALESPQMILLV